MRVTGFGIANFRSFLDKDNFVHDFGRVNVFIGKNNSGKSNVLRFLQVLPSVPGLITPGEKNRPSELDRNIKTTEKIHVGIQVDLEITAKESHVLVDPKSPLPKAIEVWIEKPSKDQPEKANPLEPFRKPWLIKLHDNLTQPYYSGTPPRQQLLHDTLRAVTDKAAQELRQMMSKLIYIPAIREVRTEEGEEVKGIIDLSGRNLVKKLRQMQHPAVGEERDQVLFHNIEDAIRDLLGLKELQMEVQAGSDDIILKVYDTRLPLDHYGTGVHELIIMCSTLMLHEDHVICIEEPKIHLHPELLRKFVRFLATTKNTYFIATHSNVLLDADETNVIYHISHDGNSSKIVRSRTNNHSRAILRDLGYRASDLLQTNGIIWVEGPSDRIYLKRWFELLGWSFTEGVDYSIMFYGGACLANLSAADSVPAEDFVELLRINSNVVVVIDRDGDSPEEVLREYKKRILEEIGENKCWITKGREIENYLPETLLGRFLKNRYKDEVNAVIFKPDDKIDDCIKRAVQGKSLTYGSDKKGHARQICKEMTAADIDYLDLKNRLNDVFSAIQEWNAE